MELFHSQRRTFFSAQNNLESYNMVKSFFARDRGLLTATSFVLVLSMFAAFTKKLSFTRNTLRQSISLIDG